MGYKRAGRRDVSPAYPAAGSGAWLFSFRRAGRRMRPRQPALSSALSRTEASRQNIIKAENTMAHILRLAGIEEESIVDGPGLRMTVFVQGCLLGCPGCQNPQTHDLNGGTEALLLKTSLRSSALILFLPASRFPEASLFCSLSPCSGWPGRCTPGAGMSCRSPDTPLSSSWRKA